MPFHRARLAVFKAVALAALVVAPAFLGPSRATPATAAAGLDDRAGSDDTAALLAAQDRSARAEGTVDSLKRAMSPGHLLDPMPALDRVLGLESLRVDYAEMQRKAAGYRATLGDHHPTLAAAEQLMGDLRARLLDGTRTALAAAEHEAVAARAGAAAVERRRAARDAVALTPDRSADITGSLRPAPLLHPSGPTARSDPTAPNAAATAPPARFHLSLHRLGMEVAGVAGTALAAALGALLLLRTRPGRPPVARNLSVEPGLGATSSHHIRRPPPPAQALAAVPVLASMALPASARSVDLAGDLAAARDLHATLRDAFDGTARGRMTVLMAVAEGLSESDADDAALMLALAAAMAGHRPLLMEARISGRLRHGLLAAEASPLLIETGGAVRTLYRLVVEGLTVAVLPSDAGEAEAATVAAARPETPRLRGLSAFDTVLLLGDDAAALAQGADLVLVAAPSDATAAEVAAAARPLGGADRPCGALLVRRAAPVANPRAVGRPEPRRRGTPETARGAIPRLGLRGSLDPARHRVGG